MKFGVFLDQWGMEYDGFRDIFLEAELLGYDSVWACDHFFGFKGGPGEGKPIVEAYTGLASIAPLTKKIRLGTLCTNVLLRNPALLTKMITNIDIASEGRFELGIGAGHMEPEMVAYGFGAIPSPRERVQRLNEALRIIKGLWTKDEFTFQGKFYSVKNASLLPKPIQKPHPPITIGTLRGPILFKTIARHANKANFGFLHTQSIDNFKKATNAIKAECQAIGRDFNEIELSCEWYITIRETEEQVKELEHEIYNRRNTDLTFEQWKERRNKGWISGYEKIQTPEECIALFRQYQDAGMTSALMCFGDITFTRKGLRLFADDVIKNF